MEIKIGNTKIFIIENKNIQIYNTKLKRPDKKTRS